VTTVYLDVCCLNRPFDDQSQPRVRLEAEAVLYILAACDAQQWEWISSEAITLEISRAPDPERRRRVQVLASRAHRKVILGQFELVRAEHLERLRFSGFDALHLACAERGGATVFLTTDDKLLRKAAARAKELQVQVRNPLTWLREVG
jgi:predicted nucleic acid-binding protein